MTDNHSAAEPGAESEIKCDIILNNRLRSGVYKAEWKNRFDLYADGCYFFLRIVMQRDCSAKKTYYVMTKFHF